MSYINFVILKSSTTQNIELAYENKVWAMPNKERATRKSGLTKFRKRAEDAEFAGHALYFLFQDDETQCISGGGVIVSEPANDGVSILPLLPNEVWQDRVDEDGTTHTWFGKFQLGNMFECYMPLPEFCTMTNYSKRELAQSSRAPFSRMLNMDIGDWERLTNFIPVVRSRDAKAWTREPSEDVLRICMEVASAINELPGSDHIYENSAAGAAQAFEMISSTTAGNRGICIGDLQSGKTGMMVVLAHAFPRLLALKSGESLDDIRVGVMMVTNKSLTQLCDQTEDRLSNAGFINEMPPAGKDDWFTAQLDMGDVTVSSILMSSAGKRNLQQAVSNFRAIDVTHTLMLLDETHVAMKENNQIASFLSDNNWLVQRQGSNVYTPPLYIAGVTATALDQFVLPDVHGDMDLYYTNIPAGDGYYGVHSMLEGQRLRDLSEVENDYDALEAEVLSHTSDVPKYILVRLPTQNKRSKKLNIRDAFMSMSEVHGWETPVEFSTAANADYPIARLETKLNTTPRSTTVLFIKVAAGAGITFNTVKHVGSMWNFRFKAAEASIQAEIGRSCGYANRSGATYPIYCHLSEIVKYADAMISCTNNEPIPELRSARAPSARSNSVQVSFVDGSTQIQPHHLMFGDANDHAEHTSDHISHLVFTKDHKRTTTTEGNDVVDVAKVLLGEMTAVNRTARFECHTRNNNHQDSHKRLMQKYPQLEERGMYCWVDLRQLCMRGRNSFNSKCSVLNQAL